MPNRLADSTSPYLLQHADNPVEWQPWDAAALSAARDQQKPIFLSIGYAACHWCHVMAHESFEDPETAAILNQHFINIKVDREERPDLDAVYMDAVVAMTGSGGWPMSVFLTPEGAPFFGGTYFPPESRHNLPGFRELLIEIAARWESDRDSLQHAGEDLVEHLRQTGERPQPDDALSPATVDQALARLHASYDWRNGGWGSAPKFPQSAAIQFLLARFAGTGDKLARDIAVHALRSMANGGIYDQLAGGFCRYSVDARWDVPHFEKMLYDNALLLEGTIRAWQLTADRHLEGVAMDTFDFLQTVMRDPAGGYSASMDADSDGEEGRYYIWDSVEIDESLGESADLFRRAFGVGEHGSFEGKHVLRRVESAESLAQALSLDKSDIDQRLEQSRQILLKRRQDRTAPAIDDKVISAWNGFLLSALAAGAAAFGNDDWLHAAQQLAVFLDREMRSDGRLQRTWRRGRLTGPAFLEDHAAVGLGWLALYQVDFNVDWYRAAVGEAGFILDHFRHPEAGFYDTSDDRIQLVARPQTVQDSPTPSGNALAVQLLLKLYGLSGDERYREPAEQAIGSMVPAMAQHPTAFASWLSAADYVLGPQPQLAIVGAHDDPGFQTLAAVAHHRFWPALVIAGGEPDSPEPALLRDRSTLDGQAAAYLCQQFSCQLPTASPEELTHQLESLR